MATRLNTLLDRKGELKAEGLRLLDVSAEKRTDEQKTRLAAIESEVTALDADIAMLRKLGDEDRQTPPVQTGQNRASLKPWGPELHSDATPVMQREARRAAIGEFAIAVKTAGEGKGLDPRLMAAASGMGTMNGGDGGFAVPPELAAGIEAGMMAGGEILSRIDARTITGDSISYNVIDETSRAAGSRQGGVLGYWVDQGTAPTATQPKLARIELKLRKVAALGYMTDELVADAAGLGGELESLFTDELIFQVEDAIVEGTGAGQPLGYQNAPCLVSVTKETNQPAASIMVANLSKMWARIPARSKKNVVWLINVDTEPMLDLLTIPAGTGAVEPRFVTYAPDGTLNIKGRPVVRVEYCATLGTVGDIAAVDLTRYRLIRKSSGPETASSMHVRFTQGEQTFKATYRCDGQPVPRSALTPFKGTNTLSPFVVLAIALADQFGDPISVASTGLTCTAARFDHRDDRDRRSTPTRCRPHAVDRDQHVVGRQPAAGLRRRHRSVAIPWSPDSDRDLTEAARVLANQYRDVFTTMGVGLHTSSPPRAARDSTQNIFTITGGRVLVTCSWAR
jgi:HK97 family phage major capsid protein